MRKLKDKRLYRKKKWKSWRNLPHVEKDAGMKNTCPQQGDQTATAPRRRLLSGPVISQVPPRLPVIGCFRMPVVSAATLFARRASGRADEGIWRSRHPGAAAAFLRVLAAARNAARDGMSVGRIRLWIPRWRRSCAARGFTCPVRKEQERSGEFTEKFGAAIDRSESWLF